MAEQKLLGPWIDGCVLQRIMFRDGLVLNLDDYNELVISAPVRLRLPATDNAPAEVVTINPHDPAVHERALFDFAGEMCTRVLWDDHGNLHVEFSDGHEIDVAPDMHATAWEMYGKHHGYAACLARGKLRVVRHDMPEDGDRA
ncbi:DUF6188 family protein [Mycobacterium talmoniae]|uniref:Uncharacterized protein n=1 Tax=Mycobacterium talmoniae TaxID=1858794 RepID=A0A1S1NI06_9MYCO|nr:MULTISPECIES: DUF6188 family protein [Mycobacterium]OHV05497.1 hypothetical protein BKN37_05375 [Mycobacterium talmoniae]PQM48395.1 hypothetical protein C1Y40_01390 [Mycobacterium talmoniae]TDH57222.1 hypothetical protein E2F47_03450 [Mycobacterium eburneum]